jgi:hypothetical protein
MSDFLEAWAFASAAVVAATVTTFVIVGLICLATRKPRP